MNCVHDGSTTTPEFQPPNNPPALTFLEPVNPRLAARKVHRLIQRGDGRAELITDGYGDPAKFRHFSSPVADIDDLFAALQAHSPLNRFAVRGRVRPDAPAVINRRMSSIDADIQDAPNCVIAVDLDNEPAPVDLDTSDIQAVGDYLRSRMPAELQPVSCVVQLSAGYGLNRWRPGPVMLKARLWFVNDAPMDGPALRRWFKKAQRADCAQMDPAVATANQPIYTAAPLFEGVADPVPVRLALLYGDQDVATIRPPDAPAPVVYPAGAVGERCPERLVALANRIQAAAESGQPRHPTINSVAFTAGRLVAGGAFTADEAVAALLPVALATGSAGAERAIHDGLAAGMKALPLMVGVTAEPPDWLDDAPPIEEDPGKPLPATEREPEAAKAKIPAAIQTWITGDQLLGMHFADPVWLLPDILPETGAFIISGKPKAGKSWWVLQLAMAVCQGGQFLNRPVPEGGVLYLALEDNWRRLQDRMIKLQPDADQHRADFAGLAYRVVAPTVGNGLVEELTRVIAGSPRKIRLIILDTLQKIRGNVAAAGSQYALDYDVLSRLKRIADDAGICLLIVHHQRKMESEDAHDGISGTNGIAGAVDGSLVLARQRGANTAVLHVTGRDMPETNWGCSSMVARGRSLELQAR